MNVGAHRSVLRSLARLCGVLAPGRGAARERPLRHTITALVLSVAGLLAFSAGVAQAEPPKLIPYGSFSSATTLPTGIAVDQSSGDIYVAGFYNPLQPTIEKLDAAGKPISPPSPFGESGDFYGSAAVDSANGHVYVVNAGSEEIDTYDPNSGALLSSFPVLGFGGTTTVLLLGIEIASDSAGNVYVPNPSNNEILKYSPSGTLLQTFTGTGAGAFKEPGGVAVDSSGDLWVVDTGNNRIEELSPADVPLAEIKSEDVRTVALDGHGDVFATVYNRADFCGSLKPPCSHLVEYNSAGVQVADVGAGSFETNESFRGPAIMVAVNESSGRVYVPDFDSELIWVFGPPAAPTVDKELTAEVGISEAKLGALVNPGGIQTSYRFEYGTTTAYGQTTPFPEGSVGEGVAAHTVWAAAHDLAPGTTYHYRVVASNELGSVAGADQTFTTETAAQATCSNEQLRTGFSARLPDCRAYELVTPPTKTSVQFERGLRVAGDGNRTSFATQEPLPSSSAGGDSYVATRGVGGWSSEDVIPVRSYTAVGCSELSGVVKAYSGDLSKAVVNVGQGERASSSGFPAGGCGGEGVETVPGEPVGYENLLLRDNTTGNYGLINGLPPGVTPADSDFEGASSDLSHVVFSERAPLTAGAPVGVDDLYEWSGGTVRLVSVLPDGSAVAGSLPQAQGGLNGGHAVSEDGSRIFFTAGGDLYVRIDGSRTVQVDASQAGGVGGGGTFWTANADGSRVFFSDEASTGLTTDTVPGSGANLYEYDLESGLLTDLTAVAKAGLRSVDGISEDGSYVYFVAEGSLSPGATAGQPNLYLFHGGSATFIATLGSNDSVTAAQASPDGVWLAFASSSSLTGYDNIEPDGKAAEEIFLYNASAKQLACASCNPSGEAPGVFGGATIELMVIMPRYLSDSGRLFFDTRDALVPSDTNSQVDVYEYEDGEPKLISGGTSAQESSFLGASEDGSNAFFLTRQELLPQDNEEEGRVIYDARIDGGFSEPSLPPACTTADSCRTPVSPQPLLYGAPSSQTFSGAGNLAPTPEAKVKPKSKPAKCKKGFVKRKVKGKTRCARNTQRKARKSVHANKRGH